ncbi:MAG TPA: hypothetical protein VFS20_27025 [Longimicrobium sp.]|nr:hypothetical protein [Longimicrobium sp.]
MLPLLVAALLGACTQPPVSSPVPRVSSLDSLYDAAIQDAAVWRAENVLPLHRAHPDSAGNVRVVTFTGWTGFANGTDTITLTRDTWVTMVPEVQDSCRRFGSEFKLRLNQLLGLPANSGDSLMVEMTVPASAVFRPAADPAITTRYPCGDIKQQQCGEQFPPRVEPGHVQWMAVQLLDHWQVPGGYPWTRLGYTYNWHPGSPRYGASEYVVRSNTVASAKQVYPVRVYCAAT